MFTSTADNLVYGDGNTPPGDTPSAAPANGSDVFLVKPVAFASLPTPQSFSPAPTMGTEPAWRLGVTALSRANGSVVLYVAVPAAGTLTALARGSLLGRSGGSSRAARRARHARRSALAAHRPLLRARRAARRRHPHARHRRTGRARPGGRIDHAGVEAATRPYAGLAAQPGGLSANASLTFTARGEPTLHASIAVAFQRTATVRRSSKGAAARSGATGPRGDEARGSHAPRGAAGAQSASCVCAFVCAWSPAVSAAAEGGEGGAVWRLEQPLPTEGARPARRKLSLPIGLGQIGDIEFWEPNRGLLITHGNGKAIPPGVWAYDGVEWREIAEVCGATEGSIAWAGPDEFWTVSDGRPGQVSESSGTQFERQVPLEDNTLCHFAGGQRGRLLRPPRRRSRLLPGDARGGLHPAAAARGRLRGLLVWRRLAPRTAARGLPPALERRQPRSRTVPRGRARGGEHERARRGAVRERARARRRSRRQGREPLPGAAHDRTGSLAPDRSRSRGTAAVRLLQRALRRARIPAPLLGRRRAVGRGGEKLQGDRRRAKNRVR